MSFVPGKCTQCGANISVDNGKELGVCPYCQTAYRSDKAIENNSINTTNNAGTIVNHYYTPSSSQAAVTQPVIIYRKAPPRPRISILVAILGLFFYIVPGVLYIGYKMRKQKEWDKKYGG